MPGSRPKVSGVTVAVLLAMLTAIGVALATRSVPSASAATDSAEARALTTTPQALSMGGAVPTVGPATKPAWTIRNRQTRVSDLASVFFIDDLEGFAGGYGSLLVTHDGGGSWTPAAIPDVGGAVVTFACASPSECVAGGWTATDAAQLLYTRDGGTTWQPATLPSDLRDLTHLACWGSSHCLAVGQGTGQSPWELQSTDAGQSWTAATPPPGVRSLTTLVCSAVGGCLAGGGSAAFANSEPAGTGVMVRSTDAGRTWQPVVLPPVPP
ncbi:MAG: hypothetical protein JO079_00675, partial [Frankiaceae bacterium]|nr:hypothetical protein [Frankiaceae bacterium]